ncbi:MAG: hypothetical protein ACRDSK_30620 [Actinophytocola sp.]|uniref:hypothetical protein n=1 Tax=Actinophytocola sp. TaxID=1872138 RepID=UPI003D6A356D
MPMLVAAEVVSLWPRGVREATTAEEASVWPAFVVVVGEHPDGEPSAVTPLFDMLDRPRHGSVVTIVTARSQWSILDPRLALMRFGVRASVPVRFAAQILIPAQQVVGLLEVVARGATIGITTRGRAYRLTETVGVREALRELVLLSCGPSRELAELAGHISAIHGA